MAMRQAIFRYSHAQNKGKATSSSAIEQAVVEALGVRENRSASNPELAASN